jgi:hypothetical protein
MDVPQLIRKMVRSLTTRYPNPHDNLLQVPIYHLDVPKNLAEIIMIDIQNLTPHHAIVKTDIEDHPTVLIIRHLHMSRCAMAHILDGSVAALVSAQQNRDITVEVVVEVVVSDEIILTECVACTFGIEIGVETERETEIETEKEIEKGNGSGSGSGREEAIHECEITALQLMNEEEESDDHLVQNHNHA